MTDEQAVDREIVQLSSKAAKLRDTFATDGWREIIAPGILSVRNVYINKLIGGRAIETLTDEVTGKQYEREIPESELRAVVKTCGWFLGWEADLETTQAALAQAIQAAQLKQQAGVEAPPESATGSPLVAQDN